MNSLSQLNAFAATNINVTDNRLAKVKFDRVRPLLPLDQSAQRSTLTVTVNPGINIVEIIKFATANVRLRVKTIKGDTDPIATSTVAWASLPTGVTLTTGTNVYTLSGINTVAAWEAIKSFSWTVSSDYTTKPLFFLNIAIVYYDESLGTDVDVDFNAYDPDNYYVAKLSSSATLVANNTRIKRAVANLTSSVTVSAQEGRIKNAVANLTSTATLTANVLDLDLATANLTSQFTVTASINKLAKASASITSISTMTPYYVRDPFKFQINTTATRNKYNMLLSKQAGSSDLNIDWGDGTSETFSGGSIIEHTYSTTGYKDITITGNPIHFLSHSITGTVTNTNRAYVQKVYSWGGYDDFKGISLLSQPELTSVPEYLPINYTHQAPAGAMQSMFGGCTIFNSSNVRWWNTSKVVTMASWFANTAFNQPLSLWDTSSVTDMSGMFDSSAFNQDISSWNTGAVTNMSSMFNTTSFNQELNTWNTSSVTNMNTMFKSNTVFNKELYNWNTGSVTNMSQMFSGANAFNKSLNTWTVGSVTNMSGMFSFTNSYNQPMNNWDTANVTNMQQMFWTATAFNQNLSSWDVHLIATKPSQFDTDANAWTGGAATRPQWGTTGS